MLREALVRVHPKNDGGGEPNNNIPSPAVLTRPSSISQSSMCNILSVALFPSQAAAWGSLAVRPFSTDRVTFNVTNRVRLGSGSGGCGSSSESSSSPSSSTSPFARNRRVDRLRPARSLPQPASTAPSSISARKLCLDDRCQADPNFLRLQADEFLRAMQPAHARELVASHWYKRWAASPGRLTQQSNGPSCRRHSLHALGFCSPTTWMANAVICFRLRSESSVPGMMLRSRTLGRRRSISISGVLPSESESSGTCERMRSQRRPAALSERAPETSLEASLLMLGDAARGAVGESFCRSAMRGSRM